MLVLRDPPPGKGRWRQAFDLFVTWTGLNIIFTKVLLQWLLNAPLWALWVSLVACLIAALGTDVFTTANKREMMRAMPDASEGSATNADGAAVSFHEHSSTPPRP